MRMNIAQIVPSMFITLLLLIVLDIIGSSLFPIVGLTNFRLPFNILIILYLAFKLEHPSLGLLILLTQYFHSFFSIEGWAMGSVTGILIWIAVSYLRDLIHFSSMVVTSIVTQISQCVWFAIVAILISLKSSGDTTYLVAKFWRFIPESIIISLIAPFIFILLDKIWSIGSRGMQGDEL